MSYKTKGKNWLKPLFDFEETEPTKKSKKDVVDNINPLLPNKIGTTKHDRLIAMPMDHKNWMKSFDPISVEDLAVHNKKILEVEDWLACACGKNSGDMLLLSGPVGCGKTATISTLSVKYNIKMTEWVSPIDVEIPSEYGDYEYKVKQSTKFLDFILNAANFTSLLDANSNKVVLVEDFPNTFMRTPSEFTDVLNQYKQRAKSPIVFVCSESNTDNKNTSLNLFTPNVKEQFNIHHITFNGVSTTGLRGALKRVADIIKKNHKESYNVPTADLIECVVNSSGGDVRSAVLNLHFACLKGSNLNLETSFILEKEVKSKSTRKKKPASRKFMSLGKDQTVSILHGVGRVLNPKYAVKENGSQQLTHSPTEVIEQFLSQPNSFLNFLEENYLPHFSCIYQAEKASSTLSDGDYMLAEWREKTCQEYGLYTAVAGLMLYNKSPVSAWNPVRGPKNMKIKYPSPNELRLMDPNYLYKGKVLVTDFETYCKIIV